MQFQADLSRSANQSEVLINSHRVQINTALSAGYTALTAPVAHGTFKLVLYCCLCVCMCVHVRVIVHSFTLCLIITVGALSSVLFFTSYLQSHKQHRQIWVEVNLQPLALHTHTNSRLDKSDYFYHTLPTLQTRSDWIESPAINLTEVLHHLLPNTQLPATVQSVTTHAYIHTLAHPHTWVHMHTHQLTSLPLAS